MRAGEIAEAESPSRRRAAPAPAIRALAALVLLAVALLVVTGTLGGAGEARSATQHRPEVEVLGEQVTRPTAPAPSPTTLPPPVVGTTPSTSTTPTTLPAAPPTPPPAVESASDPVATTCADAIAYLAAHQAPGFTDVCADGSAFGHLGVTCVNQPGMCPGARIVHIACPAPFVYMNEAHNSWTLTGARSGIDPYGQGSAAERAACAHHR